MKIIILAGGLGTRLSEHTKFVPKPMVKIGRYPIIIHIMQHYIKHGFNEFIIAAGYKAKILTNYFSGFKKYGLDFEHSIKGKKCNVNIVNTGKNTMTGGRIKRLKNLFKSGDKFMFTYGDGVSDVNLKKLLVFHKKKEKLLPLLLYALQQGSGKLLLKKI